MIVNLTRNVDGVHFLFVAFDKFAQKGIFNDAGVVEVRSDVLQRILHENVGEVQATCNHYY